MGFFNDVKFSFSGVGFPVVGCSDIYSVDGVDVYAMTDGHNNVHIVIDKTSSNLYNGMFADRMMLKQYKSYADDIRKSYKTVFVILIDDSGVLYNTKNNIELLDINKEKLLEFVKNFLKN